jgi:1-aminocyclopropane-1-carboxylate deaminase
MLEGLLLPSPLVELEDDRLARGGIRLLLKRDDLISAELPGNKYRKLKYNLAAALAQGHRTLLTFGGAYSNHLRAVAAAGAHLGLQTIALVRGEQHTPLNPSLGFCVDRGMRLHYVDRTTYRTKHTDEFVASLRARFGDFYLIPEGGSNALAVRGCAEVPAEIAAQTGLGYDVICCPVGTGGTLAGVAAGLLDSRPSARALGFAALKNGAFLVDEVRELQRQAVGDSTDNWSIELGFHGGGFARRDAALDLFTADFTQRHGLTLEPVYVSKMLHGLFSFVESGRWPAGTIVTALITG